MYLHCNFIILVAFCSSLTVTHLRPFQNTHTHTHALAHTKNPTHKHIISSLINKDWLGEIGLLYLYKISLFSPVSICLNDCVCLHRFCLRNGTGPNWGWNGKLDVSADSYSVIDVCTCIHESVRMRERSLSLLWWEKNKVTDPRRLLSCNILTRFISSLTLKWSSVSLLSIGGLQGLTNWVKRVVKKKTCEQLKLL